MAFNTQMNVTDTSVFIYRIYQQIQNVYLNWR